MISALKFSDCFLSWVASATVSFSSVAGFAVTSDTVSFSSVAGFAVTSESSFLFETSWLLTSTVSVSFSGLTISEATWGVSPFSACDTLGVKNIIYPNKHDTTPTVNFLIPYLGFLLELFVLFSVMILLNISLLPIIFPFVKFSFGY